MIVAPASHLPVFVLDGHPRFTFRLDDIGEAAEAQAFRPNVDTAVYDPFSASSQLFALRSLMSLIAAPGGRIAVHFALYVYQPEAAWAILQLAQ